MLAAAVIAGPMTGFPVRALAEPPATVDGMLIAGYFESAIIAEVPFRMRAKLDTGADTTAIHSARTAILERDDARQVRFVVTGSRGRSVTLERRLVRMSVVRNLDGPSLERPVVMLEICVGTVRRLVEVSLADRTGFSTPLLIGRNFLAGRILVDSGRASLLRPSCRGR